MLGDSVDGWPWGWISQMWAVVVSIPGHALESPGISVQFSCSVLSDSLWPRESQHARPPCPSPIPRVHPNPCPLSQWCHATISSSVVPFSSRPQSFPVSGSFPMSQLFTSGSQSIGTSPTAPVLPVNIQGWSPLILTSLISLLSKGLSRSLLQHHSSKASILWCSAFFMVQLSQPYVITGKTIVLTVGTFVGRVMSLLVPRSNFNVCILEGRWFPYTNKQVSRQPLNVLPFNSILTLPKQK